jgi:tetratricopeptide (TPR) repeat protein
MKSPVGFLLLLLLSSYTVQAQSIDSLMTVLDTARNERKVKTLNELFRAYLPSDPVNAMGYAREALTLATRIDDKRGTAAAYNNMGVAYRNQGALDKALGNYINSLKIFEILENKEGIASAKNNISTIYAIKGDHAQALKYLEEAHAIFSELGDQRRLVGTLNNLGNVSNELQLYDNALKYYSESYKLSESLGQPFADPLNNTGNVYFRQDNFQQAIEYYRRALALEKANNDLLGTLNSLSNIGIAYTKAGQPQPALQYLNQARELAIELKANSEMPEILKNTSYNYHRLGNLKQAYELFLQYDSARELTYGEESTRRIAQMEMVLQLSDKEREYEALRKEAEVKSLQLRNSRLFIVLIILSFLLIVAGINYFMMDKLKEFFRKI